MKWVPTTPLAAIDTETTGVDPFDARVVDIALALIAPGRPVDLRTATVDPGIDVPEEAAKIHGFTTERVRAEGKPAPEVLDIFLADIAAAVRAGAVLVAHNAAYDLTVLRYEAERHGLPSLEDRLGGPVMPVLDTLVADKRLIKFRKRVSADQGARQLKTCAQVYGVPWNDSQAHGAAYDALISARVAWRMGRWAGMSAADLGALRVGPFDPPKPLHRNDVSAFQRAGAMDPAGLHEAQVEWAREQADDFGAWLRQQGNEALHRADVATDDAEAAVARKDAADLFDKADGVSGEWPTRTAPAVVQGVLA